MTKTTVLNLALASSLGLFCVSSHAAPVNLTTWSQESYPAVAGFSPGVWTVGGGGTTVTQSVNGQPTLFVGDFNAFGTKITGKVRAGNDGDDDYIGFALGFASGDTTNPLANYLLIDWKQGTQNFDFGTPSTSAGGLAPAGLAVSRVTGIPDADEFWQHDNLAGTPAGSGLIELARGTTLGNVGWTDGTEYEFTFDFGPNDLEVFVNGVKQLDISGSFSDGRLAFYNFSQSSVVYSAFELDEGSFPPDNKVPEPASWALLALGLAGLSFSRRRRTIQL